MFIHTYASIPTSTSFILILIFVRHFLILFLFSWFCHFDDDQYVNVAALETSLQQFDQSKDWYLGKPSIAKPLDILDRDSQESQVHCPSYCHPEKLC